MRVVAVVLLTAVLKVMVVQAVVVMEVLVLVIQVRRVLQTQAAAVAAGQTTRHNKVTDTQAVRA
jgi:hypothetical protein